MHGRQRVQGGGNKGNLGMVKEGCASQVHVCKYIQPGKQAGGISSAYSHRTMTLV